MATFRVLFLVLALAMIFTACGDDDDDNQIGLTNDDDPTATRQATAEPEATNRPAPTSTAQPQHDNTGDTQVEVISTLNSVPFDTVPDDTLVVLHGDIKNPADGRCYVGVYDPGENITTGSGTWQAVVIKGGTPEQRYTHVDSIQHGAAAYAGMDCPTLQ